MAEPQLRVLLADDHALFREGLAEILNLRGELTVVGQAGDGVQAVRLAATCAPDIVLLDVEMPEHQVETTIRQISLAAPLAKIVVLSMHDDPRVVRTALAAGAHGYLAKSLTGRELVAALHTVRNTGERVVVSISRESLARYGREVAGPLSPREVQVLELAALALTNIQIASRLGIAEGTVKRHLTNAYTRLGADSRIDAINKAMALGALRSPAPQPEHAANGQLRRPAPRPAG